MYIIDVTSGTILAAKDCVLLNPEALTEDEWENVIGDTDICDMAKERGRNVLADITALDLIAALLTGQEWSPDYLNSIADIIEGTGRIVSDI
jgi:hypothetical protein